MYFVVTRKCAFWGEAPIADLCRMWAEGLSASEIGRAITDKYHEVLDGYVITKNSIIGQRQRLDLPRRKDATETPISRASFKRPITLATRA